MATPVITIEIDKKIRILTAEGLTVTDICLKLGLIYDTVASHMHKNKIRRNYETKKRVGRPASRKPVPEGYFDEHEHENWLI